MPSATLAYTLGAPTKTPIIIIIIIIIIIVIIIIIITKHLYSALQRTQRFKGVLHPWALFLKTLYIFSKNKATSDEVSYGSGQKCSKELKNHSFTSVETIVVKLQ